MPTAPPTDPPTDPPAPSTNPPADLSPVPPTPATNLPVDPLGTPPITQATGSPVTPPITPPITSLAAPATDAVRLARAYLSRVAEPYPAALAALIAEVGPVEAAALVRSGEISPSVASQTSARRGEERAHADLAAIARLGGRLVIPEDEEWPRWPLLGLENMAARRCGGEPIALWVRGPHFLADAVDKSVAVVGSRAASTYGEHVAGEFAYGWRWRV